MTAVQHSADDATNVVARPERVLLVSMPLGAVERPSLALGLLLAHCTAEGVSCDTQYLNLAFAERIGLDNYLWLCNTVPYTAFAGDWIFASALYGDREGGGGSGADDDGYVDEVLKGIWHQEDGDVERILTIRGLVEAFLLDCLEGIRWQDYTFVGFTSIFQQNIASLAMARMVARRYPDITIAFGGANWEEVMGAALMDRFDFVRPGLFRGGRPVVSGGASRPPNRSAGCRDRRRHLPKSARSRPTGCRNDGS